MDFLSLSSHKIYGPQGAGALYVRPGVDLLPLVSGGGQEFALRSGTQAIPNIAGFGVAAELAAQEMATETLRLIGLRDRIFHHLASFPHLAPTGDLRNRLAPPRQLLPAHRRRRNRSAAKPWCGR